MTNPVKFAKCGRLQWRGATLSGRVYWISREFPGTSWWKLRLAENADADEGDVIDEGKLAHCRAEAQRIEREILADESAPRTGREIADTVWDIGRRFGGGS